MPLQFQTAQSAFKLGIEEGVDPHHVEFGTLLTAENVEWTKLGRLQKRSGTTALSMAFSDPYTSGTIASCSRLFTRGDELCLIDGSYVYARSEALAAWRRVSLVPEVGIRTESIADTMSGARATDMCLVNGQVVHVWAGGDPYSSTSTGTVFVQVIDPSSGQRLLAPTPAGTYLALGLRLVPIGNTGFALFIAHKLGPDVYISYAIYNLSTYTLAASGDLVAPINAASFGWDAMAYGSSFILAVQVPGATPNIKLFKYNSSMVLTATGTSSEASALGMKHAALATDGTTIWFSYFSNGAVKLSTFNGAMTETLAPTVIEAVNSAYGLGLITTDATHCLVVYSVSTSGADLLRTASGVYSTAGALVARSDRGTWYARIASSPFVMNGRYYVALAESPYTTVFATGTNTFFGVNTHLVEIETTAPVGVTTSSVTPHRSLGKIDHLQGGVFAELYSPVPNTVTMSATETWIPSFYVTLIAPGSRMQSPKLARALVGDALPADMWRCISHGQEAYLAAGSVTAYDGRSAFDYGFSRPPQYISHGTPAGALDAGKYLYGWTYEYRSAAGILHRSPTFIDTAPYVNGGTGVSSLVQGATISCKQSWRTGFGSNAGLATNIITFRSVVNGDTPQRLTVDPSFTAASQDARTATYTITDGGPDANIDGANHTLATRPTIYTAGGALDDEQPPSIHTQFLFKSRIFALSNDRMTWWYTKSFLANANVAPGFSSTFQIPFDDVQTGGATMDDMAVFLGPTGIHVMIGDGPQSTGAGNDFSAPARVQTDVGCSNPRSIVSMPDGIMFQGNDGQLYLLTRQREVQRVGRPVQDTIVNFPNVTSAVLVSKKNQVRFTANSFGSTTGVVLVYDYQVRQWSVFKLYDTSTATASCPIADACLWRGQWTFATPGGAVFYESTSDAFDGGSQYVTMKLATAWFNAAGPLGFESVRRLALRGQIADYHDLTVSVGFDSDEGSYPQTTTFLAGTTGSGTNPLERCEVTVGTRRKCSAIRFQIQDAPPTDGVTYPVGSGRGPRLDTMAIEVGVKPGPMPVSATRKG